MKEYNLNPILTLNDQQCEFQNKTFEYDQLDNTIALFIDDIPIDKRTEINFHLNVDKETKMGKLAKVRDIFNKYQIKNITYKGL